MNTLLRRKGNFCFVLFFFFLIFLFFPFPSSDWRIIPALQYDVYEYGTEEEQALSTGTCSAGEDEAGLGLVWPCWLLDTIPVSGV